MQKDYLVEMSIMEYQTGFKGDSMKLVVLKLKKLKG